MLHLEEYDEARQWGKIKDSFKNGRKETFENKGEITFVEGITDGQRSASALQGRGGEPVPTMSTHQSTTYAVRKNNK